MNFIPFIFAVVVGTKSYSCTDYNFYLKDVRNFISQCSKRTTLNFDVETPLIEASKFKGDEFNVFFSKLQKFEVCIEVRYTKLKRIAFPAIREKARARCSGKLAAIVIRDNPYLEEIVFGKSNNVRANAIPTLMVRGNRKLTNNTINKLKQLKAGGRRSKRNTIQVYGECSAPIPLQDLNDLVGCELVHGDIRIGLKQQYLISPREPLKPFTHTGCVRVRDSMIENIDFLRNLREQLSPTWICNNVIVNNTYLCIPEDFERILRSRLENLRLKTPSDCEVTCMGDVVTPEYIATTIAGHDCAVLRGDVIVKNWTGNSTILQHLKTVRVILGALHLEGNSQMKKIDFLSGLERINMGREKGAAVIIKDNPVLEEVQLISLRKVISKEQIRVIIENNPKLVVDIDEWYEIAGGKNRTKLILSVKEVHEEEDFSPLLINVAAIAVLVLVLILIVYWFGWGTRWHKFSGIAPQTEGVRSATDKKHRSKK